MHFTWVIVSDGIGACLSSSEEMCVLHAHLLVVDTTKAQLEPLPRHFKNMASE
jgi:hypothetical protein